jgi:serine/threonine-protein kinase
LTDATPTLPERKACASCGKEFSGGEVTCSEDGTTLTLIRKDSLSGVVEDKYIITGALGGGGWGTVYKAEHILLKRPVAIKTLHQHMVASGTALKRFKQEALAGSKLDHPHILDVQDFGITPDGTPYIVMDFLEGKSLADTLQAGGYLEQQRAMKIFAQVSSALAHAHRHGVVHRDLKPGNIMLIEHDGVPDYVKIVDFGIAKILKDDENDTASQLTETGQLFGSPLYMSPEQCTGRDLDGRSDIYSLGCVMYRTLTGQPPFLVRDLPDCIYKHVNETPPDFVSLALGREISQVVEQIVFKTLEKDPLNRYQTMTEVEETIRGWLAAEGPSASGASVPAATGGQGQEYWASPTTTGNTTQPIPASTVATVKLAAGAAAEEATSAPGSTASSAGQSSTQLAATGTAEEASLPPTWLIGVLVASALVVLVPLCFMLSKSSELLGKSPKQQTHTATATTTANAQGGTAEPGSEDPSIGQGIELFHRGKYDEALRLFANAAPTSSNPKGNVEALLWEGKALNSLYRYSEAKQILLDYMKKSDDIGVNAARALNALARSCASMGQTDEAQGYLHRAEGVTSTLKGPDRLVHAATLLGLGEVALGQKKYTKAKGLLQESLSINQQYSGSELEKANILSDLGEVHQFLKEFNDARKCYTTALQIRQKWLGLSSPGMANSLMCLGSLDFQQNKLAESEKHFQQALSIDRQNLGESNLEVAMIEHCLGVLYQRQKNYQEALEYFYKALMTRTTLLGDNDQTVRITRNEYTSLLARAHRR